MLYAKNILCCVVILTAVGFAETGFENRPIINNIFMPTGNTLNKGEFTIGIGPIAFGVSDKVQIGTNALSFIFGSPNANVKVNVLNSAEHIIAVGAGVSQATTKVYSENTSFVSWLPFVSYSHPVSPTTQFHAAFSLAAFGEDSDIKNAEPLAFWRGTSIDAGIEYSYSRKTKFLGEGGYDFTFSGPSLSGAVLWGWETFRLKLGVAYYDPQGQTNAFISPVLGLWWRLGG